MTATSEHADWTRTVPQPVAEAVARVRAALADQGFGVITEIDMSATLREKIGAEIEDYVVLGACNPVLAHAALQQDRSIGLLLPCNVVVRALPDGSRVEVADPGTLVGLTGRAELEPVAAEATRRLQAVLAALGGDS